jgi:hypothetical protein
VELDFGQDGDMQQIVKYDPGSLGNGEGWQRSVSLGRGEQALLRFTNTRRIMYYVQ